MHLQQSHTLTKATLLLVDDTQQILEIVQSLLRDTYQVITASKGRQFWSLRSQSRSPISY